MSTRTFITFMFLVFVFVINASVQGSSYGVPHSAFAATEHLNDSEVVEVGEPDINDAPPENTVSSGADSSSESDTSSQNQNSDAGGTNNTATSSSELLIVFDESDTSSFQNANSAPTVESVTVTTTQSSSPGNTSNSDSSSEETTTQSVNSEDILIALIGNQAVVTNSSSGSSTFGGGGGIRIYADRVREAFQAQNISVLSIPNFEDILNAPLGQRRSFTSSDFALFVASAILKDENIQNIAFSEGTLTTEYRVRGRLFGAIPTWYRLTVMANIAPNGLSTVSVRFPWYKFFLATGVSRPQLERELKLEIDTRVQNLEGEFDVVTRAFTAVAEVLRLRVGT